MSRWFPSLVVAGTPPNTWSGWIGSTCLGLVIAAGIFRTVLFGWFEGLRPYWSIVVVLLALSAALGIARSAFETRHVVWPKALLAIFALVMALGYLQPQRVASDGAFYYAPLRSVVVDFDLDFENEYRVLRARPEAFVRTRTGRLPNQFSVGPAILWSPFFLATHALAKTGLFRPTGFNYPYFTAVATASMLFGFIGVLAVFDLVRVAGFKDRFAFMSVCAVWLGSFHLWYMTVEPSMSHAPAMMSVSVFALYVAAGVGERRQWMLAGLFAGVVVLIRWQNVVFVPLVFFTCPRLPPKTLLANGLSMLAVTALVFSPQMLFWFLLYGQPFLIPQGAGFMNWGAPNVEATLFSSRHGLFSWSPILLISLLGVPSAWRKTPRLISGLIVGTLLTAYINASVSDWWAGASFGARRFDGALPLFAMGLAACCTGLWISIRRRPMFACALALVPFAVWNGILMDAYFTKRVPPDGPASFQSIAADGIERIYRKTGYPFSWPASIGRWVGNGDPLPSYDLIGSEILYNNIEFTMGVSDALFLGRGWSSIDPSNGERGFNSTEAELFFPIREAVPYRLRVDGARDGVRIELFVNGLTVGELEVDALHWFQITVPATALKPGVNTLVLRQTSESGPGISEVRFRRRGSF